jgi:hypothetical protein
MPEVWGWLGGNTSPWDAIGSIGVILVAVILGVALSRKASAAIALASAARPNRENIDRPALPSAPVAAKETFPNFLIRAATTPEGIVKKGTIAILNMGDENAKDLRLRRRDESTSFEIPLDKKDLVIRDILQVPINGSLKTFAKFQLTFRSDSGTQYALEFEWDASDSRVVNEKLTVISSGPPASWALKQGP